MKKIYLRGRHRDKFALVDEDDYYRLSKYKWYLNHGYAYTAFHRKGACKADKHNRTINVPMAKMIVGDVPSGMVIDHINRDRLDNRKINLRITTYAVNSGRRRWSSSEYKGVCITPEGKWQASIFDMSLGAYSCEDEAALAYDKAARKLHGPDAYLNFPDRVYTKPVLNIDYFAERGSSIHRGVSYYTGKAKRIKRWRAIYKGKTVGYYTTEVEAHKAYEEHKESADESGSC